MWITPPKDKEARFVMGMRLAKNTFVLSAAHKLPLKLVGAWNHLGASSWYLVVKTPSVNRAMFENMFILRSLDKFLGDYTPYPTLLRMVNADADNTVLYFLISGHAASDWLYPQQSRQQLIQHYLRTGEKPDLKFLMGEADAR